jgi:hypothetical protein
MKKTLCKSWALKKNFHKINLEILPTEDITWETLLNLEEIARKIIKIANPTNNNKKSHYLLYPIIETETKAFTALEKGKSKLKITHTKTITNNTIL